MFGRAATTRQLTFLSLCAALAGCGGGGGGGSVNATLTVRDDAVTVAWNASTAIDVLANDAASEGEVQAVAVSTPAHGTVQIASGKLSYTPVAGYYGTDTLTYTAMAVQGGAQATATVSIKVDARLRLKGAASGVQMDGASITATVGSAVFQTVADASGAFTLPISSSDGADMIVLTAQGTGTRSSVKLLSLAGEVSAVVNAAAASGDVLSSSAPSLNITDLSTAQAAQVVDANGAQLPSSQRQLDALAVLTPLQRMADLAAAVRLVADHGVALPAGVADTWALLASQSTSPALATFLREQAVRSEFAQVRAAALSSTVLSGTPSSNAARTLAYVLAYKATGPDAVLVTYRPDGSATVVTTTGSSEGTWSVVNASVRVVLTQPLSGPGYGDIDPQTGLPVAVELYTTGYDFRQVHGSAGEGTVLMVTQGYKLTLEGSQTGAVTPYDTSAGVPHKVRDLVTAPAFTAADWAVGNRWAGVLVHSSGSPDLAQEPEDILRITGSSSALLERTGKALTWSYTDGWLRLDDGAMQRGYRRLAQDATTGEEYWLVADFKGGVITAMTEMLAVKADDGLQFTAGSALHRRWESGFDSFSVLEGGFFMDLYSDGTGAMVSSYPGGQEDKNSSTWSIDGSGQMMQTHVSPTTHAITRQREWILLKSSGSQIFVMEHLTVPAAAFDSWRLNVYADRGAAVK